MKSFFLAVGLLLSVLVTTGQLTSSQIEIGEDASGIVFPDVLRYPRSQISIGELKGKVVVLDFWSTWCAPCFRSFKKTILLQEKYSKDIAVIAVNPAQRDNRSVVQTALAKWEKGQNISFSLPVALYDSAAIGRLMPNGLPHFMWIDRNGIFRGSTRDSITEIAIEAAINGDFSTFSKSRREKVNFDDNLLLSKDYFPIDSVFYCSFLGGKAPGLGSWEGFQVDDNGRYKGMYVLNKPLFRLYASTDSLLGEMFPNRFLADGFDIKRLYSFNIWMPDASRSQLQLAMRKEVDRFFQASGKWMEKEADCWVLGIKNKKSLPRTLVVTDDNVSDLNPDTVYLRSVSLANLARYLNLTSSQVIVDESDSKIMVDIAIPYPNKVSKTEMASCLAKYGISFFPSRRRLPFFVLSRN